jgi:hypothetical protein
MVAGAILQGVGALANVVGAIGQSEEAKRQFDRQTQFGVQQKANFTRGYGDLINQAKGLSTYQADISKFTKAEQAAALGKQMAGGGRVAGEDIARQQAMQSTANTLAAAQRSAGSSSDLLTAALMGQQQEGAAMQNIDVTSQQQRQQMGQQAQQNYLQSLGQTAAAQAQQAGLQFESESSKQQQLLGLSQQQFQGGMALDQSIFEQQQASAAAVQNAKSAIWSGIGGVASSIGGGLTQMQNQTQNMDMLKRMYPSGAEKAVTSFFAPQTQQASLGLGSFFGGKQLSSGVPSANMPAYQAPSIFPNQPQTNYSGLLNPLAPRQ